MDVFVKDGDEYKPLPETHKVLSNDDLSSGYIPKGDFGPAVQQKVDERFRNHVHRDKVFEDEVLVAQFKEQFSTKGDDIDLDAQREQWATARLKPVQTELQEAQGKLEKLTARQKHAEIRRVFGKEFDDSFTERIDPLKPSQAEVLFGDQFDFDYDTTTISIANSQMSPEDFVSEIAADPKLEKYLRAPERNDTRAKIGQDGKAVTKSGHKPSTKADVTDIASYVGKYGMRKPKVKGWPALMELK